MPWIQVLESFVLPGFGQRLGVGSGAVGLGLLALPLSAWLWARYFLPAAGWWTGSDGNRFCRHRWWCSIATGCPQLGPDLTVLVVCRFLSASAGGQLPVAVSLVSGICAAESTRPFYCIAGKLLGVWAGSRPRWCLISFFRKPAGTAAFYSAPCPCFMCRWCLKSVPNVPYLLSRGKLPMKHTVWYPRWKFNRASRAADPSRCCTGRPRERIRFFQLWQYPFAWRR